MSSMVIAIAVGYVFGNLPTAYLLGRMAQGIDIREHGSGNVGASNATIVLGWRYGLTTAIVDILKGLIPMLIVGSLYPAEPALPYLTGLAAIIGHIFPLTLRFRGGKGIATLLGLFLGLDWRLGVGAFVMIIAITWISDYIVFGSLTLYVLFPVAVFLLGFALSYVLVAVGLTALGFYKHAINLRRLPRGEEVPLSAVMKKTA